MLRIFWYNDLCHDLMYSLLRADKFSMRSREYMKTAMVSRAKYLVEQNVRAMPTWKQYVRMSTVSFIWCLRLRILIPRHRWLAMDAFIQRQRVLFSIFSTLKESASATCYLEVWQFIYWIHFLEVLQCQNEQLNLHLVGRLDWVKPCINLLTQGNPVTVIKTNFDPSDRVSWHDCHGE